MRRRPSPNPLPRGEGTFWEVLTVFLRLGLTSFGGPVAHLGYFREEIVIRRKWLDEAAYADLVALCQFLPGPASSQVGIALGLRRAGLPGGLAAWLGFTTPSAIALILFAYGVAVFGDVEGAGWQRAENRGGGRGGAGRVGYGGQPLSRPSPGRNCHCSNYRRTGVAHWLRAVVGHRRRRNHRLAFLADRPGGHGTGAAIPG